MQFGDEVICKHHDGRVTLVGVEYSGGEHFYLIRKATDGIRHRVDQVFPISHALNLGTRVRAPDTGVEGTLIETGIEDGVEYNVIQPDRPVRCGKIVGAEPDEEG